MKTTGLSAARIEIRVQLLRSKHMKYLLTAVVLCLLSTGVFAVAQQVYDGDDYTIELPSAEWKVINEADGSHAHAEFVYGDRLNGYLQIRKEAVDADTTPSDFARHDLEQKLTFVPDRA